MLTDALNTVLDLCSKLQLSFYLSWAESENLWYSYADGQGEGEYFEIKRAGTSEQALERLAEKLVLFEAECLERMKNATT